MRAMILCVLLTGCVSTATDSGCAAYGESRLGMPRPLGGGALAEWVAVLDSRMTGVCR